MWITIMGLALSMLTNVQYRMAPYSPYGGARRGIHLILGLQRTVTVDPLHIQSYSQPAVCGGPRDGDYKKCGTDDAGTFKIKQTAFSLWVRPFFYALIFNLCFQVC